jgi:type IV secretory pathway component VirB8
VSASADKVARAREVRWEAQPVPPEVQQAHYAGVPSILAELRQNKRAMLNLGLLVGTAGVIVGVAGMVCAASLFPLKTVEHHWTVVDQSTGWVGPAIGPADAPRLFTDATTRKYLKDLVEACEGYVADTVDLTFHHCTAMLSPAMQTAYNDRVGERNKAAPRNALLRKGIARIEPEMRFQQRPRTAANRPNSQSWIVRFIRSEIVAGQLTRRDQWVAEVAFEWHPEMTRGVADQIDNPAGMVVFGYNAEPEAAAKGGEQ